VSAPIRMTLRRVGTAAFEAEAGSGGTALVDGSPEIGGEGRGMRPMEALLMAIGSCSAMDVVAILTKQKQPLEDLTIHIEGTRAETVPKRYVALTLVFEATGDVHPGKLERAVSLSMEKYCSVSQSLDPAIAVTYEARLVGAGSVERDRSSEGVDHGGRDVT
jgi:putative redox protein